MSEGGEMKPTDLLSHPEGGRFKEVFRSAKVVTTEVGEARAALTHIYFSLEHGEVSKFHRVTSDEVWNLYEGSLRLYLWDTDAETITTVDLSPEEQVYCHVVPAGVWQAAEPLSDSTLVGCSVGPGFDFVDFTLIDPVSPEADALAVYKSELQHFI